MASLTLQNGKIIGDYEKPYIIAEMNSSHSGDINLAKEMIYQAKECGCDCVKFQSWTADTLYSKAYYDQNRMTKRIVEKFSLSEEELLELCRYCSEVEIDFSSTPYTKKEVDFLVEKCHVPFIKIASMELNHYVFLEYIARKQLPIILSTGMGSMEEIKKAVTIIEHAGNRNLCILHCVSSYPAQPEVIHLRNIEGIREIVGNYPVGYSDHSLGAEIAAAAVAMGAAVIEKHFTLDHHKIGMDNQMATEPEQMKALVTSCQNVYLAMGHKERVLSELELEQSLKMRRSVIAGRDIKKGQMLCMEDLDAKRPGTGIPADKLESLIGKQTTRDMEQGQLILEQDYR